MRTLRPKEAAWSKREILCLKKNLLSDFFFKYSTFSVVWPFVHKKWVKSTTNTKIADVLGAAVASRDNANSKKMLGFHTGSGVYVLRGMVDAVGAINGASAGSPLWLGASGASDSAPPTTANHYSRIVGYFVGTGTGSEILCYFDPSRDWVQIDS